MGERSPTVYGASARRLPSRRRSDRLDGSSSFTTRPRGSVRAWAEPHPRSEARWRLGDKVPGGNRSRVLRRAACLLLPPHRPREAPLSPLSTSSCVDRYYFLATFDALAVSSLLYVPTTTTTRTASAGYPNNSRPWIHQILARLHQIQPFLIGNELFTEAPPRLGGASDRGKVGSRSPTLGNVV